MLGCCRPWANDGTSWNLSISSEVCVYERARNTKREREQSHLSHFLSIFSHALNVYGTPPESGTSAGYCGHYGKPADETVHHCRADDLVGETDNKSQHI